MPRTNGFRRPLDIGVDNTAAALRLARLAEERFRTQTIRDPDATRVRIELDVMVEQPMDRADALRAALDLVEDWLVREHAVVEVTLDGRRYSMQADDFAPAPSAA